MDANDLTAVIDLVRQRLSKYDNFFSHNELLVRYVLIDPVLRTLGWMTDDPELVHAEMHDLGDAQYWRFSDHVSSAGCQVHDARGGKSPDYALMSGWNQPRIFIEVKCLNERINAEKVIKQCIETIDLCKGAAICSFIVTNGQKYERYDLEPKAGGWPKTPTLECDIEIGDSREVAQKLLKLIGQPKTALAAAE
jgi:hypothetical protein